MLKERDELRLELAQSLLATGQYQEAVEALRAAMLSPASPEGHDRLQIMTGEILLEYLDRPDEALDEFKAVATRRRTAWSGQALFQLAECYEQMGDQIRAFDSYVEVVSNCAELQPLALRNLDALTRRFCLWDRRRLVYEVLAQGLSQSCMGQESASHLTRLAHSAVLSERAGAIVDSIKSLERAGRIARDLHLTGLELWFLLELTRLRENNRIA